MLPDGLLPRLDDVSAVLWDFDGVVADTEPRQMAAFADILRRHGVDVSPESLAEFIGEPEARIWATLRERCGISTDIAELKTERSADYLARCRDLRPNWFVTPLLDHLAARGIPSWIVSSGSYKHIGALLDLLDLRKRFDAVLCEGSPDDPEVDGKRGRLDFTQRSWGRDACLVEDRPEYLRYADTAGWLPVAVSHGLNDIDSGDWPFTLVA